MPSESVVTLLARFEELLATGRFQNFMAQCHSRDVLRSLRTPEGVWPDYTATLDEDLVYTAQYLLYIGLKLKASIDSSAKADECLTLGAEILEHAYSRSTGDDPERSTQVFTAALAYYMAGHFARAFVLVRDLEATRELPRFIQPLRHLLLKDFKGLRSFVVTHLLQVEYGDENLAAAVASGDMCEDEAYCRVFEGSLFRVLTYFLEYMKSGSEPLLVTAEALLESAIELAIDQRFADWWWYCSCLKAMLQTYRRHSLWRNLEPLLSRDMLEPVAEEYIRANYRLSTPIVELWPSQTTAIAHLLSEDAVASLCLRMPTSAGKTKIAELAILRFLVDFEQDLDAKCIYVAPFRALAVEIEHTLKKVFNPLGTRVSELYGGFELTAADRILIERTRILVATPEKLDALFRFSPEVADNIRLVIFDEGHIVSEPDFKSIRRSRGLKYEVFLHRMVRRFEAQGSRVLFLSAVMPNAEQFAEWITGDPKRMVSSDWRPSRLMLGEVIWNGSTVHVEYTHAGTKPIGHRCFVPSFVTPQPPAPGTGGRRRASYPRNGQEALALSAIEFATHGMTMVFVARKTSVEALGRILLECIEDRRARAAAAGQNFDMPLSRESIEAIAQAIEVVHEHIGSDSIVGKCLVAGVVIHHGGLPQPVRLSLERLVRTGSIRLIVATTTLAQGVNFPIRTVLVHSLDHNKDDTVSPMDFWNICGRAGRGMKENEGQVLFFVNDSYSEWLVQKSKKFKRCSEAWKRGEWNKWRERKRLERGYYVTSHGQYQVNSAILSLVRMVHELWRDAHPTVNVADLCEALANHRLDLFAARDGIDLESLLSTFDGLTLALMEGEEVEEITPDIFDEILTRSLAFLQLPKEGHRRTLSRIFAARLQFIYSRHPEAAKRRHFYRLGLPLRDCERVEAAKDRLIEMYMTSSEFFIWDIAKRADLLANIAEVLFELDEIRPAHENPPCWRQMLQLWLLGQNPTQIAHDSIVAANNLNAHAVSGWIDDVCAYRLPWGYNMLSIHMREVAGQLGYELPSLSDHFSALVKYGVHEPTACWLLSLGVRSRLVALRTVPFLPPELSDPESLLEWLRTDGLPHLENAGLDADALEGIREAVVNLNCPSSRATRASKILRLRVPPEVTFIPVGSHLLIQPVAHEPKMNFRVHTLSGQLIGAYSLREPDEILWKLLGGAESVTATIRSIDTWGTYSEIEVFVASV